MVGGYVFSDFLICQQTSIINNICGFQKILWKLYEGNILYYYIGSHEMWGTMYTYIKIPE